MTAMILLNFTLAYFVGDIPFVVAPQAVWFTAVPFALVFMLMGAAGRRVIARVELVELFKGSKLPETNIRGSMFYLIASLALIGTGYYWATLKNPAKLVLLAIPILIVVIAGTFLFFWGGLPQVLGWLRKNRLRYFHGENLIALSIFGHRIRSIGSVMAVIAVMSAVGVTAIATGYTLYGSMEASTYDQLNFDLYFYGGREVHDEVHNVFAKHGIKIVDEYTVTRYQVKAVQIDPQQTVERVFRIYSESDYNRLIEVSRKIYQPIEVKPGQVLQAGRGIAAYAEIDEPYNDGRQSKLVLSDLELAVVTRADMANVHFGAYQMLVVSDEDFDHLVQTGTFASVDAFGEPLDEVTV
ncbi:MAG TPA: ABC transporter permease, partial [Limnochordia bacterium]|nr:ABC transporter permease [Limnochordia bacterium]